ncbi:MAG: leader peptide processing enzyme [Treponema sp.]|nr:leader peptide processing enzyme [Treponema sp.]
MNKKTNTLLFILGATLFNMIVTVVSFFLLIVLFVKYIMPLLPEEGRLWGVAISFIAAVIISFFAYRFALKILLKKIQMEKYFVPIFGRKKEDN